MIVLVTPIDSAPGASEMAKQRAKFAMKVGVPGARGSPLPSQPSNRSTYEEKFVPPRMSMVRFIILKSFTCDVRYLCLLQPVGFGLALHSGLFILQWFIGLFLDCELYSKPDKKLM